MRTGLFARGEAPRGDSPLTGPINGSINGSMNGSTNGSINGSINERQRVRTFATAERLLWVPDGHWMATVTSMVPLTGSINGSTNGFH